MKSEQNTVVTRDILPSSEALTAFYWAFVIYGSLVPFDFKPIDFEAGWANFQHIQNLDLGMGSRADWIANILLYIPLSAGLCSVLDRTNKIGLRSVLAVLFSATISIFTAFAVEYFQQFDPPRTVSINDLVAETLGTGIGIAMWLSVKPFMGNWQSALKNRGLKAIVVGLGLYAAGYLTLAIFPFDFVVSTAEFSEKLAGGNFGWLTTPGFWSEPIRRLALIIGEGLSTAPLGGLWVLQGWPRRKGWLGAVAIGALLGISIEITQLFLASGVSQGASVLSRMVGMALGWWSTRAILTQGVKLPSWTSTGLLVVFIPYLIVISDLNGLISHWVSLTEALVKLDSVRFMPFYYHYYTTETHAVASVLSVFGMFSPIGAGFWLWRKVQGSTRYSEWNPALLALLISACLEAAKLFVVGKNPDPTNVFLAAGSAYLAAAVLAVMGDNVHAAEALPETQVLATVEAAARPSSNPLRIILGLGLSVVALVSVASFPIYKPLLGVGLIAYAIILWWRPAACLLMIPICLPLVDLADRTGRFFWTEFDLLLTLTLAVLLIKPGAVAELTGDGTALPKAGRNLWYGFVFLFGIGIARGAWPFPSLEVNSFSSFYSPYNALRVGKGVLWAFILTPVLAPAFADRRRIATWWLPGVLIGLAGTTLAAILERHNFVGLFDLAKDFRAMANFNEMNVGGGSIDAYLVMSLPFITGLFLVWRGWRAGILGVSLFASGFFVLILTFSRIDAAAIAVSILIIVLALDKHAGGVRRRIFLFLGLLALVTGMVSVTRSSEFARSRWAVLGNDFQDRLTQWEYSLHLRPPGITNTLFGAGTGSYPKLRLLNQDPRKTPATYQVVDLDGERALQFGVGTPTFLLQRLPNMRAATYRLRLALMSPNVDQGGSISICTQSILYSIDCVSASFHSGPIPGQWQEITDKLDLTTLKTVQKPLYFSIASDSGNVGPVFLRTLSMRDRDGREVLENGNFVAGHDRWFFTNDLHVHWHAKSLWVHLLVEQGWLCLLTFMALCAYAFHRLRRARNNPMSVILRASLAGCLVVGITDSILDSPKIAFMFCLLIIMAIQVRPLKISANTGRGNRHYRGT